MIGRWTGAWQADPFHPGLIRLSPSAPRGLDEASRERTDWSRDQGLLCCLIRTPPHWPPVKSIAALADNKETLQVWNEMKGCRAGDQQAGL